MLHFDSNYKSTCECGTAVVLFSLCLISLTHFITNYSITISVLFLVFLDMFLDFIESFKLILALTSILCCFSVLRFSFRSHFSAPFWLFRVYCIYASVFPPPTRHCVPFQAFVDFIKYTQFNKNTKYNLYAHVKWTTGCVRCVSRHVNIANAIQQKKRTNQQKKVIYFKYIHTHTHAHTLTSQMKMKRNENFARNYMRYARILLCHMKTGSHFKWTNIIVFSVFMLF